MGPTETRMRTNASMYGENATSEQIKSDIDHTRHEMDETIDQLSERLNPRRLLDEVRCMIQDSGVDVGGFAKDMGRSIGQHVRQNPIPFALIGTGIAWMIVQNRKTQYSFESTSGRSPRYSSGLTALDYPPGRTAAGASMYERDEARPTGESYYHYESGSPDVSQQRSTQMRYETDMGAQSPEGGTASRLHSMAEDARERARATAERVRERARQAGATATHKARDVAHQAAAATSETFREGASRTTSLLSQAGRVTGRTASQLGDVALDRAGRVAASLGRQARVGARYSRDSFVEAKEEYPLTLATGFLALGMLAGLSMPRTQREDEMFGPTADKIKERAREAGREIADRGAEVASATLTAAQEEARAQGLTPSKLMESATEVGSEAAHAGMDAAQQKGQTAKEIAERADQAASESGRGTEGPKSGYAGTSASGSSGHSQQSGARQQNQSQQSKQRQGETRESGSGPGSRQC